MRFTSLCAPVDEVDTPSRLLAGRLRTGETTVTRGDPAEAALTPLQFASTSLPDAFYGVLGVLPAAGLYRFTVRGILTMASPQRLATPRPPMTRL